MNKETREKKQPTGDYSVGYCRTPTETRYPPGQSGNPKGRKKGSKNHSTILKETLSKKVPVTANGKTTMMTMHEAMIIGQVNKAAKGDTSAFKAVMEEVRKSEAMDANGRPSHGAIIVPGMASDYAAFERMAAEQQAPHRGNNPKPDEGENSAG